MKAVGLALLLLGIVFGGTAFAQDFGVSELRGGIYAHSWDEPGPNGQFPDLTHIDDLNLEVLFDPLPTPSWLPGLVRPNLGATIDFGGMESMAYAGLSWKLPIWDSPFFFEGGLGGSVNNGAHDGATFPDRDLGCNLLFHEQATLGYDLTQNVDVMLTLEHASSANICSPNRGLSNVGFRVGWKF